MSESATVMIPEPMPMFGPVQLAAAGFLARYSGRTRDAYALDLKTYFAWCAARGTEVFEMTRPHVEVYVRWMEEQRHYAPATTARRLSTVAGYYRFAVIDGYLDRSPAEYVRRPHVPEESQVLGLDRMQLGALVAAARASSPDEAALITMLGLLGLRIGQACSADVEDMGTERGHRTLHIIGKGNKPALIPLPVPVPRTLDLAAAERVTTPRQSSARRPPRRCLLASRSTSTATERSTPMVTTQTMPSDTSFTTTWLALTKIALVVGIVSTIAFAVIATGWTTSDGGKFTYRADYWYTGVGLPLAAVGLLLAVCVYRLQPGRTGRRGTVGVWINGVCCVVLFANVLGSLVTASELRWGPAYPLCALGTVVGLALLAAGSWRVGIFPRWLLGVWPFAWMVGSFFAQGATPLLLTALYIAFWVVLSRRTASGQFTT